MRALVLVAVISALVTLVACGQHVQARQSSRQEWAAYKQRYGKVYESPEEDARRFALFMNSKAKVEMLRGAESHERALNHLSDWSEEEIARLLGYKQPDRPLENSREAENFLAAILEKNSTVPDQLDWRQVPGRVSAVKDQGECGSCWAFSTTGLLEGQELPEKGKKLVALSEQELVDCVTDCAGCSGGNMDDALKDLAQMGGVESEQDYPYTGTSDQKRATCKFDKSKSVIRNAGYSFLPDDEEKMREVVAKYGPISVAIDSRDLIDYKSGVYDNDRCFVIWNHAVLVVGYGSDPKQGDYWLVKNSWGEEWGEQGYFRLRRGKFTCGIGYVSVIATF